MYKYSSLLLMILLILGLAPAPVGAAQLCFPGTPGIGDCLEEPFASYWQANGGLPVFGYPISPVEQRAVEGGAPRATQWTERNRLESHPENAAPYNVLLGRMGAERLAQLGRNPQNEGQEPGPRDGCRWFPETSHNVCNQGGALGFKSYWEQNGLNLPGLGPYERSLALFGYPLTEALMEPTADGGMVITQWFERARFEWHPDKPDQYKVLLGLLGRELRPNTPVIFPPALPNSPNPPIFGVEVNRSTVGAVAGRIGEARFSWVRYNAIRWSEVEPQPGERNWAALAGVEAELQAIIAQGGVPVVIVRSSPQWAVVNRQNDCGPIREGALDDFARFMADLVARYGAPPYNIRYWEIGNEPDAPTNGPVGESIFGCWGSERDPYYGGGAYAAMLKQVYPAIKQARPDAQVLLGGLLLDCDPTNAAATSPCLAGKFFEGVLRNGGGAAFDIVSYHAYAYWELAKADFDLASRGWKHRGGVLLGKLDFLRSTMRQYGVDKPVMMTEGGLLCYGKNPVCPPNGFYNDQANYAIRTYTRGWANGLMGVLWYTLNGEGWHDGGMLDAAQQPRPAYQTARFLRGLLDNASYEGQLSNGALEGYRFRKGGLTYLVYWTNDLTTVEIPLVAGTRAVYNMFGEQLAPVPTSLSVGYEPRIIEIGD
jgi:hypothetical protein